MYVFVPDNVNVPFPVLVRIPPELVKLFAKVIDCEFVSILYF